MNKDDLLNSYNEYDYCMKDIDECDKKYYWFCEELLNITTDDDNLSIELGMELYELCVNIYTWNQCIYYPRKNNFNHDAYKKSILYKNLLEKYGLYLDCRISYRFVLFDYSKDGKLIDDKETMDWLLNDFMRGE